MKTSKYLKPDHYFWYLTRKILNFCYPQNKIKIKQINYCGVEILIRANEDVGKAMLANRFELNEIKFIASQLLPNAIFIDIGSNIGLFSLAIAAKANTIQIHSFDPIKLNNTLLASSIEINTLNNIVINETCVGNYDGVVEFSVASDSAYSSIRDSGRKPELKKVELPIIKLDTYFKKINLQSVDFIKIDVEGAEKLVLAGATEVFSNKGTRPKMMMVELSDRNLRAFDTSVKEILDILNGINYKPYVLKNNQLIDFIYEEHANYIENVFFRDLHISLENG
jgi:FkbM family methyltransferase